MDLDIYWVVFLILLPTVIFLTNRELLASILSTISRRWRRQKPLEAALKSYDASFLLENQLALDTPPMAKQEPHKAQDVASFCRTFLSIYLLVMSSEWLSGPYLYTLFRDDYALPESTVCALYATAYTSAAVSALGTGFLADRYGRRKACLAQCLVHSAACLTIVLGGRNLPILFLGRVFAGIALTLLWTVFESWMVTEWNARGLDECEEEEGGSGGGGLCKMFGIMTTANCMTAIVGGIVGHALVSSFGSKLLPFGVGIIMEGMAAVLMLKTMNENYGVQPEKSSRVMEPTADMPVKSLFGDIRIWTLTIIACCFEGTTFLVNFFWPAVLQDAHQSTIPFDDETNNSHRATSALHIPLSQDIPYGVIYASFMAAMILGAVFFNTCFGTMMLKTFSGTHELKAPVCLLTGAVITAGLSMLCLSVTSSEMSQFASFLMFEIANGVYVPSMAYARGVVVDDRSRAGLYGLMRIPLFVFVILALGITADNGSRRAILAFASACLVLAVVALVAGFWGTLKPSKAVIGRAEEPGMLSGYLPVSSDDTSDVVTEQVKEGEYFVEHNA